MNKKNQPTPQPKAEAYEVLQGLSYHGMARRAEPGDVVTDLPAKSIPWLLEQGHIKPATERGE